MKSLIWMLLPALVPLAGVARAQDDAAQASVEWDWGVLGGAGYFSFDNSLFVDTAPDASGDLSDDWIEGYIKPWVAGERAIDSGTVFGKASWAYARNDDDASEIVGGSADSSDIDDLYLGWRSGDADGDGWLVAAGRYPYQIARTFLLSDGYADGGPRAGYWSNPRKAWELGVHARYAVPGHAVEAVYLERDEPADFDPEIGITALNYDWRASGDRLSLGASWLGLSANDLEPALDGADVWNLRAYGTPLAGPVLLQAEYAREDNGEALDASAWYLQANWHVGERGWGPVLTYRYAWFEGDDPGTPANEAYDPLFPGFEDWGTWWQGEIAGEYFISNSNLNTHMVQLSLHPTETIRTGLLYFQYRLNERGSYEGGVSSDDLGEEVNFHLDWKFHRNWSTSFVLARNEPGSAVEEAFGRSEAFNYGMIYLYLDLQPAAR